MDLRQQAVIPDTPAHELLTGAPPVGKHARVYLLPGELHASDRACQITTILGSCVAVCLWDSSLRIGGMNHYLLPVWRGGEGSSLRFGDLATRALLQKLLGLGCQRRCLIAKLFGGSALFQKEDRYQVSLGAQNVEAAGLMLKNAGIPILAQDTGGHNGRKIVFNTDDAFAWSRQI